jgi:hypothetical protein
VCGAGEIKWKGGLLFIGEALSGELVGLAELDNGDHQPGPTCRQSARLNRPSPVLSVPRGLWISVGAAEWYAKFLHDC